MADTYVATAARGRGEVAELTAARKCQKYADIPSAYTYRYLQLPQRPWLNERLCVPFLQRPWPQDLHLRPVKVPTRQLSNIAN